MKRKLNENDVPTSAAAAEAGKQSETATTTTAADEEATFADLGLDARLVQAVAEQGFLKPTLVQRKAIPLALDGKDVLCKAKTGSGKTAAYVLPVLAGILKKKSVCHFTRGHERSDGRRTATLKQKECANFLFL